MSIFQGTPQTATSYSASTSETPKWMQDAIYNQIQWAQNLANKPFQPYDLPTVATLSPLQQQAYSNVQANQGFFQPGIDIAQAGMTAAADIGTASGLGAAQAQYLTPGAAGQNLGAGQGYFGQAGQTTGQALSGSALDAANPYLQAASRSAAGGISEYMSPYQTSVMDAIARQGSRNLTENILPGVSDAFIRAGQFGSGRMGEFGSRAVRDTQEAILSKQAELANQGFSQALGASQADVARQAQLASTAGGLSGTDLGRILQAGAQYGNLGQMQTTAGQAQQQLGLTAAQAAQSAQAQDITRQMSALQQMAALQQQEQALRSADVASLEGAGAAQQAQAQAQLTAAHRQFLEEQAYPQKQMDWLSTQVRGLAPITPTTQTQTGTTTGGTYSPSPLSQLATGYYVGKGLGVV